MRRPNLDASRRFSRFSDGAICDCEFQFSRSLECNDPTRLYRRERTVLWIAPRAFPLVSNNEQPKIIESQRLFGGKDGGDFFQSRIYQACGLCY